MSGRLYPNPPIEEAICEIRWIANEHPDIFGAPARFYELIKRDYPEKAEMLQTMPREMHFEEKSASLKFGMERETARILFPGGNRTRLLGYGQTLVSIHALRPYPGWEEFGARIQAAIVAFHSASTPIGIKRIGLRYINKIDIPSTDFSLGDYLTSGALIPPLQDARVTGFFTRIQSNFSDGYASLQATIANTTGADDDSTALVLDLEVSKECDELLDPQNAAAVVEELRQRERRVFEAYITDKTRNLFTG